MENVVAIRDLHKAFGSRKILQGVELDLNAGENLVILGKSGTGKSVLFKCIVGLVEPDRGSISVFGKDLTGLKSAELNELRLKIGFLFQSAALYDSMSVRENLLFPLRRNHKVITSEERNRRVEEALENVGLLDAIDKMPSELSGGMRKRVGLARTLMLQPAIVLYDEPTTGLDPATSREISELILKMKERYKISSIIITHDLACARLTADRIAVLKDGKIYKTGSFSGFESSNDEFIRSFFI